MPDRDADEVTVARYEDLRLQANRSAMAMNHQLKRIRAHTEENFQSDAEFLVLAVHRLVSIAKRINQLNDGQCEKEISDFETNLPHLQSFRNVIAHFDEYLVNSGRDNSVCVGSLSVSAGDNDNLYFSGFQLDPLKAKAVSSSLYFSINDHPPEAHKEAVKRHKADCSTCNDH